MQILVIHDGTQIKAWLAGESTAHADAHVRNGYPHLLADWEAGKLAAADIDVPEEERFRPDLYEVASGQVVRKQGA